jgi:hypothetical protein
MKRWEFAYGMIWFALFVVVVATGDVLLLAIILFLLLCFGLPTYIIMMLEQGKKYPQQVREEIV